MNNYSTMGEEGIFNNKKFYNLEYPEDLFSVYVFLFTSYTDFELSCVAKALTLLHLCFKNILA